MNCELCQAILPTARALSHHLATRHSGADKQAYYDAYLKKRTEGSCVICGDRARFINISKGYAETCSHSCGTKEFRRKLREDPVRFARFTNKVSSNQASIWEEREQTGEAIEIRQRIGDTLSKHVAQLTPAERSEKYGWMNKLDAKERQEVVDQILDKSLRKYWSTATEEEKSAIYRQRGESTAATWAKVRDLAEFKVYDRRVRNLTYRIYTKHHDQINPSNLPRGHGEGFYHIDHIVSVMCGFVNNVPPEVIAHPENLQMLPANINISKRDKSWMKLEELYDKVQSRGVHPKKSG